MTILIVTSLASLVRIPTLISRLEIRIHLVGGITIPKVRMVPQTGVVSVGVHIVLPPVPIHLIHLRGGLAVLGPVTDISAFFTYGVLHRIHFSFLHARQLPL
ncbi:hypothetical protein HanIR_Chr10g0473011 [Helianthus annuus]|nr:hypothetical protein HanIR_Chr10g0473011 [Helianthus annuus]